MTSFDEAQRRLSAIPNLQVTRNEPLSRHTRFGLGGPASVFATTYDEDAFVAAIRVARQTGLPWLVIGLGTNLIVADSGYRGIVLRFQGSGVQVDGCRIRVQAGAELQQLVDASLAHGLDGAESLTGIPGNAGAAIYGNAGAYGASVSDTVKRVRFFDGDEIRELDHAGCEFRYRGSLFKTRRLAGEPWLILSAEFKFREGDPAALRAKADEIFTTRNAKYPPEMKCAGSIFKNLILAELPEQARAAVPERVVKGGKVPSAWFLEQAGAKGLANGGVRVTDYHSNTLFNAGGGTAGQFLELTALLKRRVRERFGFELEEEVQMVGFDERLPGLDQLGATPFALQSLLTGLTAAEWYWTPAEDRWSVAEVVAHLADVERACFAKRVGLMMAEDDPEVEPYEPVRITPELGLAALEAFLHARRESLAVLEGVPVSALTRTAQHAELGTITLAHLLNEWAFHDLGHLRQIAELVRAVKYYPHMGPYQPLYQVNP